MSLIGLKNSNKKREKLKLWRDYGRYKNYSFKEELYRLQKC